MDRRRARLPLIGLVWLVAACEAPNIVLPDTGGVTAPRTRAAPSEVKKIASHEARRQGVDPALILGVIQQESGFQSNVVSRAGARGLMQLMPDTAKFIYRAGGMPTGNSFDPKSNVAGGTWYLRHLYDQLGDVPARHRWAFTLAAYNGGLGRVRRAMKATGKKDWGAIAPLLPTETRLYVPAVLRHWGAYQRQLTVRSSRQIV